jgi:membrane protein implicated in regulation of membrane protease activity
MDKLKLILFLIAVVLITVGALAVIGLFYSALQFLFFLGIVALGAVAALRLFRKRRQRQIESPGDETDFKKVDRALEEYKRKLLK